ncbi:MAG TPA: hypothetical protein PK228_07795 [Saprospiraceae bacterium]|nr:hypothetical protein [Saprospiraceae bacterium]
MKKFGKILLGALWLGLLTLLTQVGGLIWLISMLLVKYLPVRFRIRFAGAIVFVILYLVASVFFVPPVARQFGRVPLPVFSNPYLKPENLCFAIFNRHYVRPELRRALEDTAAAMQTRYPGSIVWYLDANFPFIDGYPLEPHFSHKDGKKVDLAFYWNDAKTGIAASGVPSPFGYGVCAEPLPGEYDYAADCESKGFWYISLDRTIAAPFFDIQNYTFDASQTRELARLMAEHPSIGKILIQPHLEKRLGLERYDKFRQQGCKAARHDDHFHVQL